MDYKQHKHKRKTDLNRTTQWIVYCLYMYINWIQSDNKRIYLFIYIKVFFSICVDFAAYIIDEYTSSSNQCIAIYKANNPNESMSIGECWNCENLHTVWFKT